MGPISNDVAYELRTDAELAAAATEDLDAFAELIRRHQDFVFGAVLRVVKNRTVAEDVAQDAFLRAYRGLDSFRGDAQVRSWIYRIATNLAMNVVTRRKEFPTEELPEKPVHHGPASLMERQELKAALQEAIAELPEDLREPLVMREYQEMSYQEIADATGLPLNTVRTRILRGRRALRDQMEAWR